MAIKDFNLFASHLLINLLPNIILLIRLEKLSDNFHQIIIQFGNINSIVIFICVSNFFSNYDRRTVIWPTENLMCI